MNTCLYLTIFSMLFAGVSAADYPAKVSDEAKKHARHSQIMKIGTHLLAYDSEFAEYPSDLIALAEYGIPSGDLLLQNKDGSVSLPKYYPGRPYSEPESDLLVLETTDGKGELVLSNRLNITFRPLPPDE